MGRPSVVDETGAPVPLPAQGKAAHGVQDLAARRTGPLGSCLVGSLRLLCKSLAVWRPVAGRGPSERRSNLHVYGYRFKIPSGDVMCASFVEGVLEINLLGCVSREKHALGRDDFVVDS